MLGGGVRDVNNNFFRNPQFAIGHNINSSSLSKGGGASGVGALPVGFDLKIFVCVMSKHTLYLT